MGNCVLVGFDGSPASAAAIECAAVLLPGAHGRIALLWTPPFASEQVRRRLWERTSNVDDLIAAVEREGALEARRVAATGVTLARAAGWEVEALLQQTYGGEGAAMARVAEEVNADVVVVGSRGLGGTDAVLGSVSDMVVHYSSRPVLVVPYPLLSAEFDSLPGGPVVIGWDGSRGAEMALAAAGRLWGRRNLIAVSVDDDAGVPASPADDRVTHIQVRSGRGRRGKGIAAAVVAAADDHGAAVVVIGSRGRSAAREMILGSVAMGTLHRSHRPVLVVPGRREA